MTFDNLGPLLGETRTVALCQICGDYRYKRVYHDENSKNSEKIV